MKNRANPLWRTISLLVLAIWLGACSPEISPARQATVEALTRRVAMTVTAEADAKNNPGSGEANAQAKVTELSQGQAATQGAQSQADTAEQKATRAAEIPIIAELPVFGVDPNKGHVAWIQQGLSLEVEGYNSFKADNQFPSTIASDFVLSADIKWNTRYGDSGCGFVFRSDGDQTKPSQYMVLMTRLADGHLAFTVLSKGNIANLQDLFHKKDDPKFNINNDSINKLTIVGRGTHFEVYTNRSLIGEFDPDKPLQVPTLPTDIPLPANLNDLKQKATFDAAELLHKQEIQNMQAQYNQQSITFNDSNKDFPKGFITMIAGTQSGKVSCVFNNAWLWLIEG